MSINEVGSAEFEAQVLEASKAKPVIVDFWAPWCGPCRMITPIIEELDQEYAEKVIFFKLNIDEDPDIASQYNIMSIPTVIVYKDGEVAESITGVKSKAAFKSKFDEYLPE